MTGHLLQPPSGPAARARRAAYRALARTAVHQLTGAAPCPRPLATAMAALATSSAERFVARALHEALADGDARRALSIGKNAGRAPDDRAEKIVSHHHRFIWICNPKVASRSLIAALCEADPRAELLCERTLREIYAAERRTRSYLSFAFVREPYARAHSFYADKIARPPRRARPITDEYHGFPRRGFDEVCAWLNTPFGSDAFAERHWLSQHRQIRLPDGRLPDFVGRYERLDADFALVAARLGLRVPPLEPLNTISGWLPAPERAVVNRHRRATDLDARNRALLRARYAGDFQRFGYPA